MHMVRRGPILRALLPLVCLGMLAVWISGAGAKGALVQVNGLRLKADGGFKPQRLPRDHYAPIEFQGYADIRSLTGKPPPELTEATLEFDRDGRLQTKGLPVCAASRIEGLGTASARSTCKGAIVGTGTIGLTLFAEGVALPAHAPLTLFNGPPSGANPTVNAHVHIASPVDKTFVVPVTIERERGEYAYRAHFDTPALSAGGVLTHVDAKISRRFMYRGRERSYVSARCSDGILRTHGNFLFADGTVIDGAIEKACVPNNF
jgi:hypothetical protein